ncbi:hypothetical protein SteCoe_15899 [Stentor coeruleus]|uniref:Transmembrane protein n=1 Tax=Stentor coeruleus TaxID=5963 RepID=A0A1R2C2I2_9CILI|nr:hypothetical protein SteCoe_15899 [Stentor coeruleus]
MNIKLLFSLFSFVIACNDCYSICSNIDKNKCLADCGCPIFNQTQVISGIFKGRQGLVLVPNIKPNEIISFSLTLQCNLSCSQDCTYTHIDSDLETCIEKCGCMNLLLKIPIIENLYTFLSLTKELSHEKSVDENCAEFCKGSGNGCLINCQKIFGTENSKWYLWLGFPVMAVIIVVVILIKRKTSKEDDYMIL